MITTVQNFHMNSSNILIYTGQLRQKFNRDRTIIYSSPEGFGRALMKNGNIFEGYWKKGKLHGKAVMITKTFKFIGHYVDGIRKGKGKVIFLNGEHIFSAEGQWLEDKSIGPMTVTHKNGSVYVGFINEDFQPNGFGKLILEGHSMVKEIEGHWQGMCIVGNATIYYHGGHKYEGHVSPEKGHFIVRHGKGKQTLADDLILTIEGTWINDYLLETVKITYIDGSRYFGHVDFAMERNGPGIFYRPNGDVINAIWHEDEIKILKSITSQNNKVTIINENKCRIVYSDGLIYCGSYDHHFLPQGHGKMMYPDGSLYLGFWKAGKRHGYGFYVGANRDYYSGPWYEDVKHGIGLCANYGVQVLWIEWEHDRVKNIWHGYDY